MAFKTIGLGGFNISLSANEFEVGLKFSLNGSAWERFARNIKSRRQQRRIEQAASIPQAAGSDKRAAASPGCSPEESALIDRINAIRWYHTLDFGYGIKTPGAFDHTPILDSYRLPASFASLRVLDVATFDGYWAFEFEKRGAREVYALDLDRLADIDWSPKRRAQATEAELAFRLGAGFALAKERFQSKVRRVVCNVYDLKPETFGMFDVVHSGDLLLHLHGPVKALQNMARVCTQYALISEVYFPELNSGRLLEYFGGQDEVSWWRFSLPALQDMILDAGFARVELLNTFNYGYGVVPGKWYHAVFKAYK